jgi:hypothetical protein
VLLTVVSHSPLDDRGGQHVPILAGCEAEYPYSDAEKSNHE